MRNIFYLLLFLLISCSSKEKERIENEMMLCINNIKDEKGNKLESHIEDYEGLLLKHNILENNSAKSYKNLLRRFMVEKNIKIELNENDTLLVKIYTNRFYDNTFQKIFKCFNDTYKDRLNYNHQKIELLKMKLEQLNKKGENSNDDDMKIAQLLSNNLTEKDFELKFYKAIVLEFLISYDSPPL
jgi:hypothetical protein